MPAFQNEPNSIIRQRLLAEMTSYMLHDGQEGGGTKDCGYSQQHIDRCAAIVDAYLALVLPSPKLSQNQIREAVKQIVLDLNALNEECDGSLIETDQREDFCQLILVTARKAGLDTDDDITEEWRKW